MCKTKINKDGFTYLMYNSHIWYHVNKLSDVFIHNSIYRCFWLKIIRQNDFLKNFDYCPIDFFLDFTLNDKGRANVIRIIYVLYVFGFLKGTSFFKGYENWDHGINSNRSVPYHTVNYSCNCFNKKAIRCSFYYWKRHNIFYIWLFKKTSSCSEFSNCEPR